MVSSLSITDRAAWASRPPRDCGGAARGAQRFIAESSTACTPLHVLFCACLQLQDHDSVAARPPLRGVARRLVFVDHREPEAGEAERARGMWVTSAEHLSKVGVHLELAP